jgi:hypothetical protein
MAEKVGVAQKVSKFIKNWQFNEMKNVVVVFVSHFMKLWRH